ncbi:NAD-dependent protein deacylase [Lactobacillus psittaci]|uniref:protein acetyllysine N-acetyltransferase n=1 Tax=Lactobacillus psittaci DSM 15354 TaxID=1122152 RepID=A0A0R1S8H8_9LACO|nr:NAD-dependent protein deacylase [Lactobacillus psittaci]KRL62773.1 NAD-dependent deacetylase [Lactobacillus psittaci DSM 15354]
MTSKIDSFISDLKTANKVTFLTGAGVSTHSGIPDYRSKNGIYHGVNMSPEIILSPDTLLHRPELFHQFVMNNMYFPDAKPNLIHQKIVQICNQKGELITQNIDCLDTKAGNKHVTEFHGNLYNIYCTKCHQKVAFNSYQKSYKHECGGIIRPGIVLYGEGIDSQVLEHSLQAVSTSDLIVIVGTSFVVYPFAGLLNYRQANSKVWCLNKTKIQTDIAEQITTDALKVFQELS